MMRVHPPVLLVLLIAVVLGSLALCLVFLQGEEESSVLGIGQDPEKSQGAAGVSLVGSTNSQDPKQEPDAASREALALSPDAKDVLLALQGRVVNKAGAPVADADVSLYARGSLASVLDSESGNPDLDALRDSFRRGGGFAGRGGGRGRGRGPGNRGAQGQGNPDSPDLQDLRGLLRMRQLSTTTRTKADGSFAFKGYGPKEGTLEIRVEHPIYVPTTARHQNPKETNELKVPDIVLLPGGTVSGIVVDEFNNPIAKAEVRLQASRTRGRDRGRGPGTTPATAPATAPATGPATGPEAERPRGLRAVEGRMGGRDGRRGRTKPVTTDERGHFEITQVAAGSYVIAAEADKHLPGRSRPLELKEGEKIQDQLVQLGIGAELSGIVLDKGGKPIAGAAVEASWTPQVQGPTGEGASPQPGGRRQGQNRGQGPGSGQGQAQPPGSGRGRFGQGRFGAGAAGLGGRGGMGGLNENTETNSQGEFVLDSLPHEGFRLTVQHPAFIEEVRDPVKVAETPRVEVRLDERLGISGVVLDQQSGEPIEIYGIRARRVRDAGDEPGAGRQANAEGRQNRRSGQGARQADPTAQAQAEARRAEREAERQKRQAYLVQRLGPTGRSPGETPKPHRHKDGKFELKRLLPGSYVIDVESPEHVKVAAASVELQLAQQHPPLTILLQRGSSIQAQVISNADAAAIANAKVDLLLPLPDTGSPASQDPGNRRGRNFVRGAMGFGNQMGRERVLAEARTDESGSFAFGPQLPGDYQLRVEARDHPEQEPTSFSIASGHTMTEVLVRVLCGARVFGQVLSLEEGEPGSVRFTHSDGSSETARIEAKTRSYEIKGLKSGSYFVEVEGRSGGRGGRRGPGSGNRGGGFGQMGGMGRFTGQLASLRGDKPDLVLQEGDQVRYDAGLEDQELGTVKGQITLNQKPARGLEVQLQKKTTAPAAGAGGNAPGGGRGRAGLSPERILSQLLRSSLDSKGSFEIKKVPPGPYTLTVSSSGRGGRGGGGGRGGRGGRGGGSSGSSVLHREEILVLGGTPTERLIALVTGHLRITVQAVETGESVQGAQVSLALAAEATDLKPEKWPELPSFLQLRSRGGSIDQENMTVGTYAYAVTGRGIAQKIGQITIAAGDGGSALVVQVEKGESQAPGGRGGGGTAQMLQRLDKNGDGKLTKDELEGRMGEMLKAADKDGDGAVSKEELEAMQAERRQQRQSQGQGGRGQGGGQGQGRGQGQGGGRGQGAGQGQGGGRSKGR